MGRKHNHRMATRQLRLHPFDRSRLRQIWQERSINAQIHALTGEDVSTVVDKVGTLLYVALGAAMLDGIDEAAPDIRVLRATANTLGGMRRRRGVNPSATRQPVRWFGGLEAPDSKHARGKPFHIGCHGPAQAGSGRSDPDRL
jgi:hypothetical protein